MNNLQKHLHSCPSQSAANVYKIFANFSSSKSLAHKKQYTYKCHLIYGNDKNNTEMMSVRTSDP